MKFTKMHGAGNDFIVINEEEAKNIESFGSFSSKVCHRHYGIGADGVILVLSSSVASFKMRIFNSDGSEPEMCGNGLRCLAKFVYDRGMVKDKRFSVETGAGILWPEIIDTNGNVSIIKIDMGEPCFIPEKIPLRGDIIKNCPITVLEKTFHFTALSMGNPHAVVFEIPGDWEKFGKEIEKDELFPNKTNVEFVSVINKNEAIVKVWERGAGATLACGTGACAVLVAGILNELLDRGGKICLPGGTLSITWSLSDNHVYMEGPGEEIFTGNINPSLFI